MAEVTLKDVIDRMKAEGNLTRWKSSYSLKTNLLELKGIRTDFNDFFSTFIENQKRAEALAALADKPRAQEGEATAVTATKTPEPDSNTKKSLGALGGLMGVIGGLGAGIGMALKGLATGLTAFANPAILAGAGILAGSIVAIGAGISGASWIAGKLLPTFAEGMKNFEDLDGKKLIDVGKGIGAVGAGMAVFGVGGAASGIGTIASNLSDGIVKLFGGQTPFDKMLEFQKYDFNKEKIKNNSEAMVAYGKAMASFGTGGTLAGIGAVVSAIGSGISGLFTDEPPFQKVVDFGDKYTFNKEKIQANADALIAYTTAMAKYSAIDLGGTVINTISQGVKAFTRLFGADQPPFEKIQEFGDKYAFNGARIKSNADALIDYSIAMAKYAAISVPGNLAGAAASIGSALSGLFGDNKKLPYDQIVKFGTIPFDGARIKSNSEALVAYGSAMAEYAKISAPGNLDGVVASLGSAISSLLGDDKTLPYDKIIKFQNQALSFEGVTRNAGALVAFGTAMADYAKVAPKEGFGDVVSTLFAGISSVFGGKESLPYDEILRFQEMPFNLEKMKNNTAVVDEFSRSLESISNMKPTFDEIEKINFRNFSNGLSLGIMRISRINDDRLDKATTVISKVREAFGGTARAFTSTGNGATGDQIGQMSAQNAFAAATNNIVAPTSVGPNYNGPVYNGPVNINNDSSTSFGMNPNERNQMATGF